MEFIETECQEDGQRLSDDDDDHGSELTDSQLLLFTQGETFIGDNGISQAQNFIDDDEVSDDGSYIPPNPYVKRKEGPKGSSPDKHKKGREMDSSSGEESKNATVNYCFTVFNYNKETETKLIDLYPDTIDYLCYGYEKCPTTGREHLQGYLHLKKKLRWSQVIRFFNVHPALYQCKGSPQSNFVYCTKDGESYELGIRPFKEKRSNTMNEIIKKLLDGTTVEQICNTYMCHVYVAMRDKIHKTVEDIQGERMMKALKIDEMGSLMRLRDWQSDLLKQTSEKNNDRRVFWVYETRGGVGKSYLCREMFKKNPKNVIILQNGTSRDLSFLYTGQSTVLLDYCRSEKSEINYEILEKMKNGFLTSTKYESKTKFFKSPLVICFANFPPNVQTLSFDRWYIFEIVGGKTGVLCRQQPENYG